MLGNAIVAGFESSIPSSHISQFAFADSITPFCNNFTVRLSNTMVAPNNRTPQFRFPEPNDSIPQAFYSNAAADVLPRGAYLVVKFGTAATFLFAMHRFCNGSNCRSSNAFIAVMLLKTILDTTRPDAVRDAAKERFALIFQPANPHAGLPGTFGTNHLALNTAHTFNLSDSANSPHHLVIGPFPLENTGDVMNTAKRDLAALGVPDGAVSHHFIMEDGPLFAVLHPNV